MKHLDGNLTHRALNAIRALTIDATQEAGDGHPGMPMGAAAIGYALFRHVMVHDPWPATGGTATATCNRPVTVRCCSTRCCT
jgi:hypothetical protein